MITSQPLAILSNTRQFYLQLQFYSLVLSGLIHYFDGSIGRLHAGDCIIQPHFPALPSAKECAFPSGSFHTLYNLLCFTKPLMATPVFFKESATSSNECLLP